MSVALVRGAALGTVFGRQIKTGTHTAVCEKLGFFTGWTEIVRGKRVDFGNTCHGGNE